MEMVSIVAKDAEGQIQGGIKFYHTPGDSVYVYVEWEHKGSGPVFSDVFPDRVVASSKEGMSDLECTVRECWLEQTDMVWHKHDKDFC